MSYIFEKLKKSVDNVYKLMSEEDKSIIDAKIDYIIENFNSTFQNKNLVNINSKIDYNLIESVSCNLKNPKGFKHSEKILKKLNLEEKYILNFQNSKIKITVYHDKNDDKTIFNKNIKKIFVRIHNLLELYKNKQYIYFGKKKSILDFHFVFYLYSNPRRSNKNKFGKKYLEEMAHDEEKCFNVFSGQTIADDNLIFTSRLEECIGLLTHEALHGAGLIYIPFNGKTEKNFNIFEMVTNAFSSIIHSFLSSIEYNINIKSLLKYEFYHAILHSARIKINTNISIFEVMKSNSNANWNQEALLYEYVNGRLLILLFLNLIKKEHKYIFNNLLSLNSGWKIGDEKYEKDIIDIIDKLHKFDYLERNKEFKTLISIGNIHNIFYKNIKNSKVKNDNNFIQQYFLFDPLEVENKYIIPDLHGGGK